MTDGVRFTKMVASGNDFIVLDNRDSRFSGAGKAFSAMAKALCERRFSIGADGLLVIEGSKKADIRMRILNPDGSEVAMCGNGSRCAALYAVEKSIAPHNMRIETRAGVLDAKVTGLRVKVKLTDPKKTKLNIAMKIGGKALKVHSINTGVPHAVVFTKNIDKADVNGLGSKIRYSKKFGKAGTNADFVQITGSQEIKVRTYERGVEAETLACGTGATASAIIASVVSGLKPHIDVHTASGEVLRIYFTIKGKKIKDVYLEGEARTVCEGRIDHV